ncbi:hypothetical protein QQ045_007468 [Rhodiola kirilowii]
MQRKRKNQDENNINSVDKDIPNKGQATKKAKVVTYHTSTQTFKARKQKKEPSVDLESSDSDDDFDDNNFRIVLSNRVPKDQTSVPKAKKERYSGFETRSTPKPLTDCVKNLNKEQKLVVASMGLESMLHLNLNMVRAELAEWLLDSYQSKTSTLITDRGDVDIVPKDVHYILGLPLGGRNIILPNRTDADSPIVQQFKLQYGGIKDSTVTCKTIVKKIKQSNAADDTFKINFLVLFFSTMVESTKSGVSNQRILNGIEGTDDIRALKWCEFIYTCLRDTKDEWAENRSSPYTGPITFLMALYINTFEFRQFKFERHRHAIKGISDKIIAKRMKLEMKKGDLV